MIASSSYEPSEAEIRTIIAHDTSTGVITLSAPLMYGHVIHKFLSEEDISESNGDQWWSEGGSLAPEVGLLSRNIVIQGGEEEDEPLEFNHYGCRILVSQYRNNAGVQYSGSLRMDFVEIRHCGQGGYFSPRDPRYSIAFRNNFDSSEDSYVRRCSIHHGYNTGVGIHTSNGIEISDNVLYRTTDSSIKVGGANNSILDNLALLTSTVQPNRPKDNHAVDFPATFDVDQRNLLTGNAAAGTNRISFRYGGEHCHSNRQPKINNEVQIFI